MNVETAFDSVNLHIKNRNFRMVRPEVDSIVDYCRNDPFTLLKCASLLKVIDDEERSQSILDMVMDALPDNDDEKFSIAVAMRSMNRPWDTLDIINGMDDCQRVYRERARAFLSIGDAESAYSNAEKLDDLESNVILRTDVLCALGRFDEAHGLAEGLAESNTYDSLVNLCNVMIRTGSVKEALKLVRSRVKDDKKNADSLALGAYVLRINGKMSSASNFANNALRIDHEHIGALETMALCLIEKGKFIEAKLLAGVINNKEPGHPAAIRILDACRISSQ